MKTRELTQLLDTSTLAPEAKRVLDVYRRIAGIFERTSAAMGRVPKYRVTMSNTDTRVRIGDDGRQTP
ncbi:MAG TPA: hypothetical protein VNM92_09880 [Thermoanaerobaculia bacterium]|nr:hypothetical protein [Thermoanaerobaculia bacterium]